MSNAMKHPCDITRAPESGGGGGGGRGQVRQLPDQYVFRKWQRLVNRKPSNDLSQKS